jgi:5-methylcytosine-specific restriction enzyme B
MDPHLLSVFVWELFSNLSNPFSLRKQVVRHGAPGTGKTFKAMQDAKLQFDIWKAEFAPCGIAESVNHIRTVQFHPSYTYEDFMEGLRPTIAEGISKLHLENGIFKRLCIEAGQWELDLANEVSHEMAREWSKITIDALIPFQDKLKHPRWIGIFQNHGSKKVSEAVPPFFLIIDEINRAELSRVLGELMFCLEYRGINGAIETQYSSLNNDNTGMLKVGDSFKFFIPHNIFVIGTMNNVDRSVESFDFALRRRFRWEEVGPDLWVLEYHLKAMGQSNWLELVENLEALNEKIAEVPLLGPHYQIGHAYLMNLGYANQLTLSQVRVNVWEDFIKPLLEEYLRGTGKTKELLQELSNSFGLR